MLSFFRIFVEINTFLMKKYIINKDFKKLKKGQEVELTEEFAEIFTKRGLIGSVEEKKDFTAKSKGKKPSKK